MADYDIWYGDTGSTVTGLNVSVEISSDYAGFSITPTDVSVAFLANKVEEVTEEALDAVLSSFWDHGTLAVVAYTQAIVKQDGSAICVPGTAVRTATWNAGIIPQDVPFFLVQSPAGELAGYVTSYTLEEGDTFIGKPISVKSGKYTG